MPSVIEMETGGPEIERLKVILGYIVQGQPGLRETLSLACTVTLQLLAPQLLCRVFV